MLLRKVVLRLLKTFAFDTTITHHFTNYSFFINIYNHKGYWFHGKNREANTIKVFQSWIKEDFYVLEIGAHIGYFSTFYAHLTGENGKVDVFEPSETNAKYLFKNIAFLPETLRRIITVVQKGAGDVNEVLDFYIDPISGQNNSFVKNFDGFFSNRESSAESKAELQMEKIEVITLDSYFQNSTKFPDFVKVDVEGFEWNVISGFKSTIEKAKPSLMIEIQADAEKIIQYFKSVGYTIYNDQLNEINGHSEYLSKKSPNIFFKHNSKNDH